MSCIISNCSILLNDWNSNGMSFLPEKLANFNGVVALISHGYTSHKGQLLNWATRLCEEGACCLLFDQPGHYLGSFNEVKNFNEYKENAHLLYAVAYKELLKHLQLHQVLVKNTNHHIVLAGHSLSALLAIKALQLPEFEAQNSQAICVGLGLNQKATSHIFQTPFYKSTLRIREQLVSPELRPSNVFEWVGEEKKQLNISNQKIHFITGQDDVVVGENGTESLIQLLDKNNQVSLEKVPSLPHHRPEYAAAFIKKHLKSIGLL